MSRRRNSNFFLHLPGGVRIRRERVRQALGTLAGATVVLAALVFGLIWFVNES